ncbi:MAG: flagellar motor protein MotB [Bdellovibrionota bacterium]
MALRKLEKNKSSDARQLKKIEINEGQQHGAVHDESNWLVSYADMMTLLCGFFILLFSLSRLDEPKYESIKKAVAEQFGGVYKSPTEDFAKFITEVIQEAGVDKEAVVRSDPFGVSVIFESTVFFDTLSADVRQEGKTILDRMVEQIMLREKKESKKYRIVVEGHTDSRPVLSGVFPSNWELSGARAARVVRMFLEQGFPADRLTAIGYADTYPMLESRLNDGGWNEEALAKNRRVVVRILNPKMDSIPFPDQNQENSAH